MWVSSVDGRAWSHTTSLPHHGRGYYRVLAAKSNGVVNAVFNSFVLKVKSRLVILLGVHFYNTEALKLKPFQIINYLLLAQTCDFSESCYFLVFFTTYIKKSTTLYLKSDDTFLELLFQWIKLVKEKKNDTYQT